MGFKLYYIKNQQRLKFVEKHDFQKLFLWVMGYMMPQFLKK